MITIIAGSRKLSELWIVELAISHSKFNITTVVSGAASGVDLLGEKWAVRNNIPVVRFPANWKEYGTQAGPIRNDEMAKYVISQCDKPEDGGLIAIPFGQSRGTMNMISQARHYGLQIYTHRMRAGKPVQAGFSF